MIDSSNSAPTTAESDFRMPESLILHSLMEAHLCTRHRLASLEMEGCGTRGRRNGVINHDFSCTRQLLQWGCHENSAFFKAPMAI